MKRLSYVPGTVGKDPTQCRKCLRREPEIEICQPRLCRDCRNEAERLRQQVRRARAAAKE